MNPELLQSRALRRAFTRRFFEHELFSSGGDLSGSLVNLAALLGALGVCISCLLFYKHAFRLAGIPDPMRPALSWSDQEFLMSTTIAVAGLFVIICWDALFPDLTDCLVLGPLPVPLRAVFAAKLSAVAGVFAALVAAVNAVPLIAVPIIMGMSLGDMRLHRFFAAQAVASAGAALFIFLAAAGLQGVLINVLSYARFRRISAWFQLAAVFVLLAMFFAIPDIATPQRLAEPRHMALASALPSFWFLGVYQWILGTRTPEVLHLATLGVVALGAAGAMVALTYGLGYARHVRRTVEGADRAAGRVRAGGLVGGLLAAVFAPAPREHAILSFILRTLARSRTHRLVLAGYVCAGAGFALMGLLSLTPTRWWSGFSQPHPNVGSVPLVLGFFAILGLRSVFSLPVDLKANWLFRLTESARPDAVLSAVRRLMLGAVLAPLLLLTFPVSAWLWGSVTAARHTILVMLILLLTLDLALADFRKIPFTCSFLPGKLNLKALFGLWLVLYFALAFVVGSIEMAAAQSVPGFGWVGGILLAILAKRWWSRRRDREWFGFTYEERPDWEPVRIELG